MLERGLDDLAGQSARLSDAQTADGVAGKPDFNRPLGGFFSQLAIHPALDDAEEGLRGTGARGQGPGVSHDRIGIPWNVVDTSAVDWTLDTGCARLNTGPCPLTPNT